MASSGGGAGFSLLEPSAARSGNGRAGELRTRDGGVFPTPNFFLLSRGGNAPRLVPELLGKVTSQTGEQTSQVGLHLHLADMHALGDPLRAFNAAQRGKEERKEGGEGYHAFGNLRGHVLYASARDPDAGELGPANDRTYTVEVHQ
jgi:hypothetical protein